MNINYRSNLGQLKFGLAYRGWVNSKYYSINHAKTFSVIDKGINHSSITNKVKLFL